MDIYAYINKVELLDEQVIVSNDLWLQPNPEPGVHIKVRLAFKVASESDGGPFLQFSVRTEPRTIGNMDLIGIGNMTVLSTDPDKNHIRNFETKLSSTPTNSPFINLLPRQQLLNESNGFRHADGRVRLSMYLITHKENDE